MERDDSTWRAGDELRSLAVRWFGVAFGEAGRTPATTSLAMIGSGLVGPAFGPLVVGVISDAASVLAGIVILIAEQGIAIALCK